MDKPLPESPASLPVSLQQEVRDLLAELDEKCAWPDTFLAATPVALAFSHYLAQTVRQHPEYLLEALDPEGRVAACDDAAFERTLQARLEGAADEAALRHVLRETRHREMIRVAWRDLSGQADLDEVMHDLSRLARSLIEGGLQWLDRHLQERYGQPRGPAGEAQSMVVLGLGKLGGGELNFSSDIDLIFAFEEAGETDGERVIENQAFFQRLGRQLIAVLSDVTADGFCYRVDMRLRPFGDSGPLVMHFDAMEDYYQAHGREWERYALIKASPLAGDPEAGARLMRRLRPFIYRRYLDYGTLANLRELKQMINDESARRGRFEDVKHGEGGIREIEFIAQSFQLIRGGRDQALQRRDLLGVMGVLRERELLPAYAVEQLERSYRFLRRVENRLQMLNDQQTHRLPSNGDDRHRLALSLGFDDEAAFEMALLREQRRVHAHFEQVFSAPQRADGAAMEASPEADREQQLNRLWQGALPEDDARAVLEAMDFQHADEALRGIADLRESPGVRAMSVTGRQRLDRLMPLLIGAIAEMEAPDAVLPRALQMVRTIARRSVYLSLLVENPLALSQLVKLVAASPWINEQLTRHPVLLDELLDPRALYAPPDRDGLREELEAELAQFPEQDHEQMLDRLRQFKQVQTLRVAAADIMGFLPLMKVSDHLTWLAEVLLERVLQLAWEKMVERHGEPQCGASDARRVARFAVIGYGKLGGFELGYGSDLDVVFLHDSEGDEAQTAGPKVIDNTEFFARVAQRVVHLLGAFTPAGRLYEVDTRLRPSGTAGLLVSGLQAFRRYQDESAWTWEHQALVRARFVTGDAELGERFHALRREVLTRERDAGALRAEVVEMRDRMLAEHASKKGQGFHLKRDRGGITDIEFMVQYWVLVSAHEHPAVCDWPDKIRTLEALGREGVIDASLSAALADAYRDLRNRIHRLTLAGSDARVEAPDDALCAVRDRVIEAWNDLFGEPQTAANQNA
ncbi:MULTISPECIES: bifunctional [glutamate--ammonia ligase]-adenylyl-L-tyrosine phosphorylase/[glutamate--ammonia-ligase] adenylyltransferase [unclassified Thioalkalivibrio]|uniref:bifunctional [glutamate--ammonia ligase]-adenylyl-L-tyrosine phosphorylase/[glutamate--ammonia-ligase] adenylyltransferase n=1 Tax=unclassified Thioalkalivibrio TaxID=2621013 RepID=UPI00036C9920|nr:MULTISPECIES: bifunctional [glutamate--ammonia ligase]-adenylyl-L-tyrosine phosphorylase/[glutamate--ammonia-ligase] adenylyltransferase [unclassified Thioalkalivibrio]